MGIDVWLLWVLEEDLTMRIEVDVGAVVSTSASIESNRDRLMRSSSVLCNGEAGEEAR